MNQTDPTATVIRYRKKPVEVDTVQWTGGNIDELIDFTGGNFLLVDEGERLDPEITAKVYDELHTTWVLVKTGQHVVRGVKGEFYPIAEDVLAETYEPAPQQPAGPDPCSACRYVPCGNCKPADRDALRERIAEALTAAAYQCDGNCGLSERSCYEAHPIIWNGTVAGTTHIDASVTAIADAVLAVLGEQPDRAAVLLDAADHYARQGKVVVSAPQVAAELRRLAGEQPAAAGCSRCGHLSCNGKGPCGVTMTDRQQTSQEPCTCPGSPAGEQHAQDEAPSIALARQAQERLVNQITEQPEVCQGFVWIGQPFTTCDRCARPAWEHDGEEVAVEGAGPFDTRRTVRPWKPGQADAIRAKWDQPTT